MCSHCMLGGAVDLKIVGNGVDAEKLFQEMTPVIRNAVAEKPENAFNREMLERLEGLVQVMDNLIVNARVDIAMLSEQRDRLKRLRESLGR